MRRIRSIVVGLGMVAALAVPSGLQAAQAAPSVRTSVSLSAPASGVYGSAIRLTGRLWRTGTTTSLGNATIYLQRSAHAQGRYGNLYSGRTASNGTFGFSVTQTGAYDYRVYYPGTATYVKAYSLARYPVTNRKMLFDSIATTSWESGGLKVTGRAVPAPPNGSVVTLQRWSSAERMWVNQASARTSGGRVTIGTPRPASVAAYRIVTGARYPYGAGASTAKWFSHYVWRGAFTKPLVFIDTYGRSSVYDFPASEDPGRNKIKVWMSGGGWVTVRPNIAGCLRVRSWTGNIEPRTSVISLLANGSVVASGTLGPGGGELLLNADLATVTQFGYQVQPPGADGFHVYGKVQMLCNS